MWIYKVGRALHLGVKSLLLHKLRSSLTVLGLVFGVSSVVAMLSIGEGAKWEQEQEIKRLGSHNIIIKSVKPSQDKSQNVQAQHVIEYGLTYDDMRLMAATIPSIIRIVPIRITRKEARFGINGIDSRIVGTVSTFAQESNSKVAEGRFISDLDEASGETVCVIGSAIKKKLFPLDDPIGKSLRIDKNYFRVVGVMTKGGAATGAGSGVASEDRNHDIYVPLQTLKNVAGQILIKRSSGSFEAEKVQLHQFIVVVKDVANVLGSEDSVRHLLGTRHSKKDYEIIVPYELLLQAERTQRIFQVVLGSIAAISLIVGGIGIMNIMLASVTERTREIGIRRSLGAKKKDIIIQFLIETVVLSTSGGLSGLLLGVMIPILVEHTAGMRTIVTLWSLLLSFCISVSVGIVFGLYPAKRAADLDPIEALRHE